jgi:hypothetical protein
MAETKSSWQTFLDAVTELGSEGVEAYANYTNAESNKKLANALSRATTTTSTTPTWLMPIAIGGGILILVLVLFGVMKK